MEYRSIFFSTFQLTLSQLKLKMTEAFLNKVFFFLLCLLFTSELCSFFFLIQIYTESQTHQYLPNSCLFSSHLYYLTLLFLVSSVPRYRIKHLYQMLLQNHGGPQLSASRVHVLMAPSLIPSLSQYLF